MLERELTHHIINSAPLPAQHKTSFIITLSLSSSVLLKRSLKLLSALVLPSLLQFCGCWLHSGVMEPLCPVQEDSPHPPGQGRDEFRGSSR